MKNTLTISSEPPKCYHALVPRMHGKCHGHSLCPDNDLRQNIVKICDVCHAQDNQRIVSENDGCTIIFLLTPTLCRLSWAGKVMRRNFLYPDIGHCPDIKDSDAISSGRHSNISVAQRILSGYVAFTGLRKFTDIIGKCKIAPGYP